MQTAPVTPWGLCFPPCLISRYAERKSLFWGRSCSYAKRNGTRGRISGICLVGCDYVSALFPISFKAAVLHKASAKSDSLSCAYQFSQGPWAAHCLICMADWMAASACATHCKNACSSPPLLRFAAAPHSAQTQVYNCSMTPLCIMS